MKKRLLVFLLCIVSISVFSQQYPVQILTNIPAPAPVNFYNYADATSLNSPVTVQIYLNDLTIVNRQIRLKTYFEGNNIRFESKNVVIGADDLFIEGGIPLILRNTELAPYYKYENIQGIAATTYGQSIPEGSYDFCFEVYDYLTGNKLSAKKCTKIFIFKNEPPILNLPMNGSNIEPKDFENIVFQWTPRHLNVSNVSYEFSLVEIRDNVVTPQTAFLSQTPIYKETTRATTIMYGPEKPQLLPNKRYAWRIKAKALKGLEEIGLFKNEGYSEVFWFSRSSPCIAPENISAEAKGLTKINVFWDEDPTIYSDYIIAYRESNNPNAQWFTKKTNSAWATIWNLKPGTTYEYKVKGKCSYQYSDFSEVNKITTDVVKNDDANYQCGIVPDEIAISNRKPHPGLTPGSQITAGDFKIVVTEITSQSSGSLSGIGYVTIPYLNFAKFAVKFNNILVNTDNQLAKGEVVTVYDPKFGEGASMTVDVNINVAEAVSGDNGTIDEEYETDYNVKDIKIGSNNEILIYNEEGGAPEVLQGGRDVTVISLSGDVWKVGEDGKITKQKGAEGGAVISENTNGVDANGEVNQVTAKGVEVVFEDSGYYSFDALPSGTSSELEAEYKILDKENGGKYKVPYKLIADNKGSDFIYANVKITDSNIVKDSIIFKTKSGAKVDILSWSGNQAKLKLERTFDYLNENIYATVKNKDGKYDITGSLITTHIASEQLEPINVVLIPVGENLSSDLVEKTKEIYAKAGVRLNIKTLKDVSNKDLNNKGVLDKDEIYGWDIDKNGVLEVGDSKLLSHYTNEEKAFNRYVKNQAYYNNKTYYVFITNVPISKSEVDGFMPLKRQFGFVFTRNTTSLVKQARTLAHELGHGIFGLEHTWDKYNFPQGATNFLMDYGDGTVLNHIDWKKLHAPGMQLYWFQGDEDGEQQSQQEDPITATLKKLSEETGYRHFAIKHCNECSNLPSIESVDGSYIKADLNNLPNTVRDEIVKLNLTSYENVNLTGYQYYTNGKDKQCIALYFKTGKGTDSAHNYVTNPNTKEIKKGLWFIDLEYGEDEIDCSSGVGNLTSCGLITGDLLIDITNPNARNYFINLFKIVYDCLQALPQQSVAEITELLKKLQSQVREKQGIQFSKGGKIYQLNSIGQVVEVESPLTDEQIANGTWQDADEVKMRYTFNSKNVLQLKAVGFKENLPLASGKTANLVDLANHVKNQTNTFFNEYSVKSATITPEQLGKNLNDGKTFADGDQMNIDNGSSFIKITSEGLGIVTTLLKKAEVEKDVYLNNPEKKVVIHAPGLVTGTIEAGTTIVTDITSMGVMAYGLAIDKKARTKAYNGLVKLKTAVSNNPKKMIPMFVNVLVSAVTGNSQEEWKSLKDSNVDDGEKNHKVSKGIVTTVKTVFAAGTLIGKLDDIAEALVKKIDDITEATGKSVDNIKKLVANLDIKLVERIKKWDTNEILKLEEYLQNYPKLTDKITNSKIFDAVEEIIKNPKNVKEILESAGLDKFQKGILRKYFGAFKDITEYKKFVVGNRTNIRNIIKLKDSEVYLKKYFDKYIKSQSYEEWLTSVRQYKLSDDLNFEMHHIIPIAVFENNKQLQEVLLWAKQQGKKFEFNGIDNGIPIQKKKIDIRNGHANHPKYDTSITDKIDDILNNPRNLNKPDRLFDEIKDLINTTKNKLENEVLLGNKDVNQIIDL